MKKLTVAGREIKIITDVGNDLLLGVAGATRLFMSSISPGIEIFATVGTHLPLSGRTLF